MNSKELREKFFKECCFPSEEGEPHYLWQWIEENILETSNTVSPSLKRLDNKQIEALALDIFPDGGAMCFPKREGFRRGYLAAFTCHKSCGPGDYRKGGKCDDNGCYVSPSLSDAEILQLSKKALPELKHIINSLSEARGIWIAGYKAAMIEMYKENYVPEVKDNDLASLASHSCASGNSIELIAAERQRQIDKEGWSAKHDAEHKTFELSAAAACYISRNISKKLEEIHHTNQSPLAEFKVYDFGESDFLVNSGDRGDRRLRKAGWKNGWPWDSKWWKPSDDPIKNLVKAGALIAAEIDRLLLNNEQNDERGVTSKAK